MGGRAQDEYEETDGTPLATVVLREHQRRRGREYAWTVADYYQVCGLPHVLGSALDIEPRLHFFPQRRKRGLIVGVFIITAFVLSIYHSSKTDCILSKKDNISVDNWLVVGIYHLD